MTGITTTNDAINAAQTILAAVQGEAVIAKMIGENDQRIAKFNQFDKQNIIRTQLVKHAWQKIGRQVLAMHPAVVEEVRVAGSDKIPGEVLRVLPYMNPLVIFADPPVFKSWLAPGEKHRLTGRTEASMRLLGFFTYGTRNAQVQDGDNGKVRIEQRIYPTTAPEADRFGMMLVLEALDPQGKVIDLEFNSMTLYFEENQTLSETVEALMNRYHWDTPQHVTAEGTNNRHRKWMRDVLSVVVGSLFYLCSTTLEAEQVPPKAVAKRLNRNIVRKPFSMYQVGWTTGAALTRYRQARKAGWKESEQGDLAHQQDPQHRRSHFKMQWYGPRDGLLCPQRRTCDCGGRHKELILVMAYWTHIERLGEMGTNVARRVPRVNGAGSARESVRTALSVSATDLDDLRSDHG